MIKQKKTDGAIQLARFLGPSRTLKRMSQSTLATTLGVKQPTISDWTNGVSKPRTAMRLLLRDECKIPILSWETEAAQRQHKAAKRRISKGKR